MLMPPALLVILRPLPEPALKAARVKPEPLPMSSWPLLAVGRCNGWRVFRKYDVAQVAFYFDGVVDGGEDLQVAATFGIGISLTLWRSRPAQSSLIFRYKLLKTSLIFRYNLTKSSLIFRRPELTTPLKNR